ncbi:MULTISPECIES: Imm1 family immunity protein [Actinosynnema]|uniref:Imm1 family immunity protein n=1 Tax=Actinosynnema TaxID=40566 RepID=UPI0020A34EA9|nr:Imm1 family immunity protein [Actinosynnema pretiosum]MCP2098271.1 Immunity protein Imm1 [Actinosynnema pretiosum]
MVELEAWYGEDQDEPVAVRTAAELDAVLDEVAGMRGRIIVHLKVADPPSLDVRLMVLDVGLHGDAGTGALFYRSPSGAWFSRGATPEPSVTELLYYYMNSDTEYPLDCEIPIDAARRAAHEYLDAADKRPSAPGWQVF